MSLYRRVMQLASDQPWALEPKTMAILSDVLRFRASGQRLSDDEIRQRIREYGQVREPRAGSQRYFDTTEGVEYSPTYDGDGKFLGYFTTSGTPMQASRPVVAVLHVVGVIMQRGDAMVEVSGATSTDMLTKRFRSALSDPSVNGIVFDIDSPGGGVYGVQELADEIREGRTIKPIAANANSLAASAAYWLLSAVEDASVAPSGEVGSIGVYSLHQDFSKYLEDAGIKPTFIFAGDHKVEGNPFEPLSEDARAFMQQRVDEYYDAFLKAVAKGRGVSVAKVKSDFGKGRVFGATEAKAVGMVDRIETLDETIQRIAGRKSSKASSKATSPWGELTAAKADADRVLLGLPSPAKKTA